jgi:hypothetical protein
MANVQQLVKRVPQGVTNVSPITAVRAVKSEETGYTLDEILTGFNMLFLSYNVSAEITRLQVPNSFRREGLWITYVTYDKTVVTEWYNSNDIDDDTWKSDANWRLGSNMLVGDISISSEGNWVINGVDTGSKAQGPQGISPILRNNQNKLEVSYDEGKTWSVISDYIAAWFRFTGTSGSSQADNIGKIQISRDNGTTWTDLSGEFTNSLKITKYVTTLPSVTGIPQGSIYAVGPTYDASDPSHTNPIYTLYVLSDGAWVNNGKFTSIAAGVLQTLGTSETEVMSQKATTDEIMKDRYSLYSSQAFWGEPGIDPNHFVDFTSSVQFNGYKEDPLWDCAWVHIFKGSKFITITGAISSTVSYYSSTTPTAESYLGIGTTIPSTAKLCLINFTKENNPNGYGNLIVSQEGMAAAKGEFTELSNTVDTVSDNLKATSALAVEIAADFGATPIGVNALDTINVLRNWGFDGGQWVNLEGLVSSGKLFLKNNQYYTAQNIKAYPSINAMYIAAFDANDNYLGRTVISLQPDLSATFIYTKLQGAFYERIVLTGVQGPTDYSDMQLEEGFTKSPIEPFKGYTFQNANDIDFINQAKDQYIQYPTGKNYIDQLNLLYGYSLDGGVIVPNVRGIFSNKLFLKDGTTYTASGIPIYAANIKNMYIAYFDKENNFLKRTQHAMQVAEGATSGQVTFVFNNSDGAAFYVRILLQSSNSASVFDPNIAQLELGSNATAFESYQSTIYKMPEAQINNALENRNILLTGASLAFPENEWFGYVQRDLGVTGYNKAVSGETMAETAQKMHDGTLYTQQEFEDFDVFLIFHSHNQVVTDTTNIKENYEDYVFPLTDRSAQWDYVLKKYSAECYAARLNPSSRWYGTKDGKPCMVVVCTHWHDARTNFNDSIRVLQAKWGFTLCEFDTRIGFSKNQVHPVTGEQVSILHCDNEYGNTEVINGVTYGWHQTRGKAAYIQKKMASIVESVIRNL